jgi:5-methylcytosine-specific restriction enzyme A
MAVTHGHGNPNWTRDEVILALNLYFDCESNIPGPSDPRVEALSDLLRAFPHHSVAARKESFRNPDGVAFKLQNLRQVATGKGLGNVSRVDRAVWEELGHDPRRVQQLAALIRAGIEIVDETKEESDEEDVFAEGRVVTETHLRRERDPKLRKRLLEQRHTSGGLRCDVCSCVPTGHSPSLREAIFEAHHILPLAAGRERKTQLKAMALLCANCHRMVHRAIALSKRWLTLEEAKVQILGKQSAERYAAPRTA